MTVSLVMQVKSIRRVPAEWLGGPTQWYVLYRMGTSGMFDGLSVTATDVDDAVARVASIEEESALCAVRVEYVD